MNASLDNSGAGLACEGTGLRRRLRLLGQAIVFEMRKVSVFRTGFLVREVLKGLARPMVMLVVYRAIFLGQGLERMGRWTLPELTHYLLLVATFQKVLCHNRVIDLAEQIFEGYVTKYLVMPFPFFVLPLGRFLQYTFVQVIVASVFFGVGALCLPEHWPTPVSFLAVGQALTLVLLGSYCMFLTYFILNCLAFWLDVVWSLLVMAHFIVTFVSGSLVPISLFPQLAQDIMAWLFPYWALCAPIEIFLGRLGTPEFLRGVCVLVGTIGLLELLRIQVWKRGTLRYTGSGM